MCGNFFSNPVKTVKKEISNPFQTLVHVASNVLGGAAGEGAYQSWKSGGNLGDIALGAVKGGTLAYAGNALGSQIGSAIGASDIGSALGKAGSIGSSAANALPSAITNSSIGSALGNIAGNAMTAGRSAPIGMEVGNGVTPYHPKQESAQNTPPTLTGLAGLTDEQQSTNLATQGVYGGGNGPSEQGYFENLINRRLVDSGGKTQDMSVLKPIEQSYLSKLGLGGYTDASSLLEALSKWKQQQATA